MIHAERLAKRYPGCEALHDVSFRVEAGQVCGLVGPNGAGKSTLLRILATLARPDRGTAMVGGHDVVDAADAARRALGWVPEAFGVYDGMPVTEYLEFFAVAYQVPRARRRALIDDLLALTDLTAKRNADVATLSRGMRQRLALARALLHDPPVLLLDEPTSGLDPRARIEFGALVRELRAQGKTILVSSHLLEDLAGFCTTVLVLERGRVVAAGELGALGPTDGKLAVEAEVAEPDAARAEAHLAADPAVRGLVRDGRRLRFEVEGGEAALVRTHGALAAAVPLVWFRERSDRLLAAFLRHTRGEVS